MCGGKRVDAHKVSLQRCDTVGDWSACLGGCGPHQCGQVYTWPLVACLLGGDRVLLAGPVCDGPPDPWSPPLEESYTARPEQHPPDGDSYQNISPSCHVHPKQHPLHQLVLASCSTIRQTSIPSTAWELSSGCFSSASMCTLTVVSDPTWSKSCVSTRG